jgi:subtilisin family serine protease
MQRKHLFSFLIFLIAASLALPVSADAPFGPPPDEEMDIPYVPGEMIVLFKSDSASGLPGETRQAGPESLSPPASLNALHAAYGLQSVERLFDAKSNAPRGAALQEDLDARQSRAPQDSAAQAAALQDDFQRTFLLRFEESADVEAIAAAYNLDPNVIYAEPNYIVQLDDAWYPDDPYLPTSGSWGQSFRDLYGLDLLDTFGYMATNGAWDYSQGEGVVVAVIDTGVDYDHEDIAANMWVNSAEIANNGIDDDGNGYVDDVRGWNFVNNNRYPNDAHGHGTHVAGTIAAVGDNGLGIVGVAPQAQIMNVQALDSQGTGTTADLANAVVYAVDSGADVLNNSWGGWGYSRLMEDVFAYAHASGCVSIAAAGNDYSDALYSYPANLTSTIAVAATNYQDRKADFSNFGVLVDVAAPGVDILSLRAAGTDMYFDGSHFVPPYTASARYMRADGTSMAAPHASGLAALLLALHPDYDAEQVRAVLRYAVDPVDTDYAIGSGRINALNAVTLGFLPPMAKIQASHYLRGVIDLLGAAGGDDFQSYELSIGAGWSTETWTTLASASTPVDGGALVSGLDLWQFEDGQYTLKLVVNTSTGLTDEDLVYVTIRNMVVESPQVNDIYRPGDSLVVQGEVAPDYPLSIAYGQGFEPTVWSSEGLTLTGETSGDLAVWDTSYLSESDFYNLRLTADTPYGPRYETVAMIYFEQRLAAGWPQHLPNPRNNLNFYQDLTVADLEGDGTLEILTIQPDAGIPGEDDYVPYALLVYNHDGTLRWSKATNENYHWTLHVPTVGDLDGDGDLEILVNGPLAEDNTRGIHAIHHDGTPVGGNWPVPLPVEGNRMLVADVDADGKPEVVALSGGVYQVGSAYKSQLNIIEDDGTIQKTIAVPRDSWEHIHPDAYPAVGNFDADAQLEIVTNFGAATKVAVYNINGSLVSGFPKALPVQHVNRSPVVGDVNGDGYDEIVVVGSADWDAGRGGLFVIKRNGAVLSAPIELRGLGALPDAISSPSLGDLDGDGDLEICVFAYEDENRGSVYLFHHDGQLAEGWPQSPRNGNEAVVNWITSGCVLGDVNDDGQPDVVINGMGFDSATMREGDLAASGGIFAWNSDGSLIDLNPLSDVYSIYMEEEAPFAEWRKAAPVLADIDGDGLLDIAAGSNDDFGYLPGGGEFQKERNSLYVWSLDVPWNPESMEWPTTQHDPQHTGRYPDQVPPKVRWSAPADGATLKGAVTLTVVASDTQGLARVDFYDNGVLFYTDEVKPYTFSWDTTTAADGTRTLTAEAADFTGNHATADITVTVDNSPPELSIVTPQDGDYVNGKISILAEADDLSGVLRVDFYINAARKLVDKVAPYEYLWPSNSWPAGEQVIRVRAYDKLSQWVEVSITVTVDKIAPTITIESPTKDQVIEVPTDVIVGVVDDNGIDRVVFTLDDVEAATDEEAPYTLLLDPELLIGGAHTLRATAYDVAGNTAEDSVDFMIPQDWMAVPGLPENHETTDDIAWVDSDGDGDLDILVAAENSAANALYENEGSGVYTRVWLSPESERTRCVAWGDYDGDGLLDQLVANVGAPNRIYRNLGGNEFALAWSSAESEYSSSCDWGDYDNDGDLDALIGNHDTSPSRVYRNDGADTFTPAWEFSDTANPYDMAFGDYDNDGFLDVVMGNWGGPNSVYRNLGDGEFALVWQAPEKEMTTAIAWGDYDADGDLDILVGNHRSENNQLGKPSRVYRNDGGDTFTLAWSAPNEDETHAVAWGDFDADGDLDILLGNGNGQPARVYRNDGGDAFTLTWNSLEGQNATAVAWGDYDNDGDLDILVGNYYNGVQLAPNRIYKSHLVEKGLLP